MHGTANRLVLEAQGILDAADKRGRPLSGDEHVYVEGLLERAEQAKSLEDKFAALGGATNVSQMTDPGSWGKGPGDLFVNSQQYKGIKDPSGRPQRWSSGMVEVSQSPLHFKGTLLGSNTGGPGGALVPPAWQPGIVSKLFEPLQVADVFGTSQTGASQMRYVVEGTATSAAAGVADGGTKPESLLDFSEVTEPIKKIATVLPISDKFLEDAPSVQSYLNDRLGLFVKLEEECQLLRGSGTNELVGLMDASRGINLYTKLGTDDNTVAIAKVIANTGGSANLYPDTVVLHPQNWLTSRLIRDGLGGTVGQYLGGGPFTGAYGNGGAADLGLFGQQIWNTRVLSTIVGPGTALVGNFGQAAHIWRRGACRSRRPTATAISSSRT